MHIKSFLTASLMACLGTAAQAYDFNAANFERMGFTCPSLNYEQLKAIKDSNSLTLNNFVFTTAMSPADFAKGIPSSLHVLSKGKNFDPNSSTFGADQTNDVYMQCQYQWQSSLSSLTKNTHTFTVRTTLPLKLTTIKVMNENTKELSVNVFQTGTDRTFMVAEKIPAGLSKTLEFLQSDLVLGRAALGVTSVFVQGNLTSGSQDVQNCPAVDVGTNASFKFKSKIIGTECTR